MTIIICNDYFLTIRLEPLSLFSKKFEMWKAIIKES